MNTLLPPSNAPGQLWEKVLSGWAYQAYDCCGQEEDLVVANPTTLERAYDHCTQVTAEASRTFYLASGLLPPAKRRAIRALYAFCRLSDDLVDRQDDCGSGALWAWRQRVLSARPPIDDPVALAWADTRTRYHIPVCLIEQFFDGIARDLSRTRYETFDDLAEYAYGVASTVGLMSMHVIGYDGPLAVPYAVKLGVALQLTNILRDVREDWEAGRVYLPQAELLDFGLSDADIALGRRGEAWSAFMDFQIRRNRRLYAEAAPGINLLHAEGRLAIGAAADLYRAILDDIEAHHHDVFSRRAHVGKWGKLRRMPGIWWRARVRGYAGGHPGVSPAAR